MTWLSDRFGNKSTLLRWEAATSSLPGEVTICRQPGIRLYDGDSKVKVQKLESYIVGFSKDRMQLLSCKATTPGFPSNYALYYKPGQLWVINPAGPKLRLHCWIFDSVWWCFGLVDGPVIWVLVVQSPAPWKFTFTSDRKEQGVNIFHNF